MKSLEVFNQLRLPKGPDTNESAALGLVALHSFRVDALSFSLVCPTRAGHFLVWLEVLVVDKEVLDFVLEVLWNVVDVLKVLPADVVDYAQQLVVAASLIGHLEYAERTGVHDHTREDWLRQDHECVEWVAILTEGVVDEAVVEWVSHWGEQVAVQVDLAGFVVNLVLVAGTLWDFDGDFQAHVLFTPSNVGTSLIVVEVSKVWISTVAATALLVSGGVAAGLMAHHNRLIYDPAYTPPTDMAVLQEPVVAQTDSASLRKELAELATNPALGTFAAVITDTTTGETMLSVNPTVGMMPASTTKTLTAAAALLKLGPQDRISTPVYQDGSTVIIKAQGDVWLDDEAIDAMAQAVTGQVTEVLIDTSHWTGPTFLPGWEEEDIQAGYIAPLEPAMLYGARIGATEGDVPRSTTPALDVAKALAAKLKVEKVGTGTVRGQEITAVFSPTLQERLTSMMLDSDNVMAEAIGRELNPTDPVGETLRVLQAHGLDVSGVTMVDNSGLSTDNRIPAAVLESIMRAACEGDEIRTLIATLPTAGATGTLIRRYPDEGRGWVRGKTGTLTDVTALAGVTPGENGHLYSFAMITNDADILSARAAQDAIAAALR